MACDHAQQHLAGPAPVSPRAGRPGCRLLAHTCRLAPRTQVVGYLRYYRRAGRTAAIAVDDPQLTRRPTWWLAASVSRWHQPLRNFGAAAAVQARLQSPCGGAATGCPPWAIDRSSNQILRTELIQVERTFFRALPDETGTVGGLS
jgi:hypothetical protein